MQDSIWIWILSPLVGALIGYGTNLLAVRMIFRPLRPVRVLGLSVQGLVGRRQGELADSIGRVVGGHLVGHADLVRVFEGMDVRGLAGTLFDRAVAARLEEFRRMPFVAGFLTPERVAAFRGGVVDELAANRGLFVDEIERALEERLDVHEVVRAKVAAFPVERLEALVVEVARRELRAIELLGGLLGALVGLVQAALFTLL